MALAGGSYHPPAACNQGMVPISDIASLMSWKESSLVVWSSGLPVDAEAGIDAGGGMVGYGLGVAGRVWRRSHEGPGSWRSVYCVTVSLCHCARGYPPLNHIELE